MRSTGVLKERGHDIERKRIDLKHGIKQIGTYEIPVQVHPQVVATVTVDVVDEEGLVIAGQIAKEEIPPLPGEVAAEAAAEAEAAGETDLEALAEQALEAAEELEAEAEAESDEITAG
jgi:large subunit ribosomal protein L9